MASKAFEKEFAKQRKAGAKDFSFGGKKYNTKLADGSAKKSPKKDKIVSGGSTVGTSMGSKVKSNLPNKTKAIPSSRPIPDSASLPNNKTVGPKDTGVSTGPKTRPSIYKNSNITPASKIKYGPQTRANLTERMTPNAKNNSDIKTAKTASNKMRVPGRYTLKSK